MKTLALVIVFATSIPVAYSQNIIKYYGPDTTYSYRPTDVIEVSTGGYLISGFVYWAAPLIENTYHHRYYVRTDDNGDTLWTRYFLQDVMGEGSVMEQTNGDFFAFGTNGGANFCGSIGTTWPYSDYYLEQLSPSGSQVSFNQYS